MKSLIAVAIALRLLAACNVPYANETQAPTPPVVSVLQQQPVPTQNQAPVIYGLTPVETSVSYPPAPQAYGKVCQDTPVYRYPRAENQFYDWTIPAGSTMVPVYEVRGDWVVIYPETSGVRANYIQKSALCQ